MHGQPGEDASLFPTMRIAERCRDFIHMSSGRTTVRIVEFVRQQLCPNTSSTGIWSELYAVLYPIELDQHAKAYWQHTGEGISSRRAEFCQRQLDDSLLVSRGFVDVSREAQGGLRKHQRVLSNPNYGSGRDQYSTLSKEHFCGKLCVALTRFTKLAIRKRISSTLKLMDEVNVRVEGLTSDDVYLFPCGMAAIFNTHRMLLSVLGPLKSIVYG